MFEYLPYDTKAGNMMSSLYGIYKGKKKWLEGDKAAELNFDCLITAPLTQKVAMFQTLRKWLEAPSRLEIHIPFESIPHERKS